MGFDDKQPTEMVIITRLKCPKCGSVKIWVYHTESPVQYRKCRDCGFCFKTVKE